jgi:hypothetical protein
MGQRLEMNLIRKLWCGGETIFVLGLALVATCVLGLATFCATAGTAAAKAAPRAALVPTLAVQGETPGTLPLPSWEVSVGGSRESLAVPNNDGEFRLTWRSGGDDVTVIVRQQPGEGDDAFSARCHRKVNAMKLEFPRDP